MKIVCGAVRDPDVFTRFEPGSRGVSYLYMTRETLRSDEMKYTVSSGGGC